MAYLPQIKSNGTNVIILVKFVIRLVFRVVNFWVDPLSLVVRIVNLFGFPFSLEGKKGRIIKTVEIKMSTYDDQVSCKTSLQFLLTGLSTNLVVWVVDHWRFPFTINLIIPVIRLLGIRVRDVLRLVPILKQRILTLNYTENKCAQKIIRSSSQSKNQTSFNMQIILRFYEFFSIYPCKSATKW